MVSCVNPNIDNNIKNNYHNFHLNMNTGKPLNYSSVETSLLHNNSMLSYHTWMISSIDQRMKKKIATKRWMKLLFIQGG